MKKILITGSLGYIGTALYQYLTEYKYNVYGIDNGAFQDCLLAPSQQQQVAYKNIRNITENDLQGFDVIIHLSGLQNDPLNDTYPGKLYDIEHEYSVFIAECCKKLNIKFIYASSCSVYGYADTDRFLSETDETNPLTPYSANKLKTEIAIKKLADSSFAPIMLRFATLFGYSPRMRFDLYINMFVGMALTKGKILLNSDGSSWRPNVHINDICKVLRLIIEKPFSNYEVINVGNNNLNCQVTDVIDILKKQIPGLNVEFAGSKQGLFNDQYVLGGKDKRSYKVEFSKLNTIFNEVVCDTTIEVGIANMIARFNKIKGFNKVFQDSKFYRLQWMKKMIDESILDLDLNYNLN
jgi:nucleoside-diphosphate-sugar epimerase